MSSSHHSSSSGHGGSRTQALAAVEPASDTGRKVARYGCGCLSVILLIPALLLVFLMVIFSLVDDPARAGVALLAAVLIGIPYALFILWLDRNEREPIPLLLSSFLWGGGVAVVISGQVNSFVGGLLGGGGVGSYLTGVISAPTIEEFTKALAVVAIFIIFPRKFDNVLDGVIYGAFAGLGFAIFENFQYYITKTDGWDAMFELIWMRGVVSGLGGSHACYTAIFGASLGFFRVKRSGALRWVAPPVGLGLAMFVHALWNGVGTLATGILGDVTGIGVALAMPFVVLVLQLPFLILVLVTVYFSLKRESRIIRTYLDAEADDLVHPMDIDRLLPARKRTMHMLKLLLTFKLSEWNRERKRNHLLVKLAFAKWHMDEEIEHGDQEEAQAYARIVMDLRTQLAQAPSAAAVAP